jgi:hypothetical protein
VNDLLPLAAEVASGVLAVLQSTPENPWLQLQYVMSELNCFAHCPLMHWTGHASVLLPLAALEARGLGAGAGATLQLVPLKPGLHAQ